MKKSQKKVKQGKENIEKYPLDQKQVSEFVDALFKLHEKKLVKKTDGQVTKEKLFDDDETEKINLMIGSIKLPSDKRHQIIKIELPNKILPEPTEVCLIVKDLEKGLKVDHEPTTAHFRDLLNEKGLGPDVISTVMPLRELKVEYKAFETKTALCHKFDLFLADDRIIKFIPQFLGKPFYKRKKFPVAFNLRAKDLKAEFESALHTTTLPLTHQGPSSMIQIGHVGMKRKQVVENLLKVVKVLEQKFPGGWKNIRSIHIKTEKSLAIPMHLSAAPVKDIGYVDSNLPKAKTRDDVTDELSTRPGLEVTVKASGKLRIKKKPDPNWDEAKDEPLSEESEDEVEESEDEKKKVEEKQKEKKKKETKKRPSQDAAEQTNGKKKKQKKKEEVESDDEEMDLAEQKYLKRQAEGETEPIVKKTKKEEKEAKKEAAKTDAKKKQLEESDSEEELEEEELGSDGEEEKEAFDDDQDIDEGDIIKDQDDQDDEDESDEDEKLVLKNQPQTFDDDSDEGSKSKPKHVKKSKKERRLSAKKQKAESLGGSAKKNKKKGKK